MGAAVGLDGFAFARDPELDELARVMRAVPLRLVTLTDRYLPRWRRNTRPVSRLPSLPPTTVPL